MLPMIFFPLIIYNNFLQTLHRMYVVNAGPGFKKVLWPAAQKFLDPKTIEKIHVNHVYWLFSIFLSISSFTVASSDSIHVSLCIGFGP